jgi:hypothetical protein
MAALGPYEALTNATVYLFIIPFAYVFGSSARRSARIWDKHSSDEDILPAQRRFSWRGIWRNVSLGFSVPFMAAHSGLVAAVGVATAAFGLVSWSLMLLLVAADSVLTLISVEIGLSRASLDLDTAMSPTSVLSIDRSRLLIATCFGVVASVPMAALGVVTASRFGLAAQVAAGTLGFALPILNAALLRPSAYVRYSFARFSLAVNGDIPFRLIQFLNDARDAGLLRQAGAVYQFRHASIQDHLAPHKTSSRSKTRGKAGTHKSPVANRRSRTRR